MPDLAAAQCALRKTFGFEVLSARPGRDRRRDPRRPRRVGGHADRQRQVAVLPAAGVAPRRPDHRGIAADRADAQSGRAAARLRRRGGCAQLRQRRRRKSFGTRPDRARRIASRLHRARTAGEIRNARSPQARQDRASGGRRGALHFAMGPRFPPGIRGARQGAGRARRRADGRVHRDGRRRHAHRYFGKAVRPPAGGVRARLRSAQPASGDAGQSRRPQAGRGFHQKSSRAERHRLLRVAAQDRGAGRFSAPERRQGAALSRRHGAGGALAQSGRLPAGGRRRHGRDRGVRHGHRQAGCALRPPRRHAGQYRKLLPGDRPRRPRRAAGRHADALRHGRHPPAPLADRRERRLGRAEARRSPAAQCAGLAVRIAALPAADAARLFRRDGASRAAIAISVATAPK